MARKKTLNQLTRLELELMKVLWTLGPSTVQEVQRALSATRELAYTTVQTMLNLLHKKNKVHRTMRDRAYVYDAAVSRDVETRAAMGDIIDRLFGGSAEDLVLSLVEAKHLSPEELKKLNAIVEQDEIQGGK